MGLLIIVDQSEQQTAECLFFRCSARTFIEKRLDAFAYLSEFRFIFDNAGQRAGKQFRILAPIQATVPSSFFSSHHGCIRCG